jgi:trigger factor
MKVNVEKLENNFVQLNIEIDADVAAQEYNKACRKIGERVAIPGFRKGKAPRTKVESHVGVDRIQKDALDRLLPNVLADSISEHQFDIASEPVIETYNFVLGEPLTVVAKLEIKPEVTLNNYKGLTVEVPEFKHPEDAVEKELKALSERFATMQTVIDRPTNEKDVVIIDFAGTVNGEPIKSGSAKNHQLDLANSNFIKGFAEQLIDKKISDEFAIKVTFPESYHDAALSGKEAEFQIKINEIKEKIVPEIDDELAKKVGPFQSLAELKKDLQSYLEKTEKNENDARAEQAVVAKIIEQAQVEVPDSMVNREAKVLMEEVQGRVKSQGLSWEQFLDSQGHENIWNNLREEATRRVKSSLILGAIAKKEDIQLNDEDFVARVKELAIAYNTDDKTIFKQISQNPGFAQAISQQIMGQKIVKYAVENNNVKYIEDTSKASDAKTESEE